MYRRYSTQSCCGKTFKQCCKKPPRRPTQLTESSNRSLCSFALSFGPSDCDQTTQHHRGSSAIVNTGILTDSRKSSRCSFGAPCHALSNNSLLQVLDFNRHSGLDTLPRNMLSRKRSSQRTAKLACDSAQSSAHQERSGGEQEFDY